MKILVNGQIKTLKIVNLENGCNYEQDLIGNENGFDSFDPDLDLHSMTLESYAWWENFINAEKKILIREQAVKRDLNYKDKAKFEFEIIDTGIAGDMESVQSACIEVLEKWESKTR